MVEMMFLQYKEKTGQFDYIEIENRRPKYPLGEYGWETIALTYEDRANLFCNVMESKLHRREARKLPPYTAEHIKKEWKQFCYIYNFIVTQIEISPGEKEYISKHFNPTEALARLCNGHFSDIKEEQELSNAWEYNPRDFNDSNF